MGPHEPYWRTNTSFSPPPSRWDFRIQSEGLSFGSHEGGQLYGSSTSSNSRDSRSWLRGNYLPNHQYSASDGVGPYFSSPSDVSPAQQWTPPIIQEISVEDYRTSSRRVLGPLSFSPTMEGTSATQDSGGSTSFRSDSSDYESMAKLHPSQRNFSNSRRFMSKPIHPLSFPSETPGRESAEMAANGFSEFDTSTPQRDRHRISSASGDIDFTDVSEPIESDFLGRSCISSDAFRCGLCERLLSQRSPWRSGEMPVAGVLSCRHVFHAECLEQATPKARKSDPPCPVCDKSEDDNSPEQRVLSKLRNGFPRLRPFREDGPSRTWACSQAGDCVEGALHAPPRNSMLLLNRNRVKKNLSLKGNLSKEFPGKLRKSGPFSSQLFLGSVDQGAVGPSRTAAGSSMK
ncbi:hypothetical protein RJ639_040428 [Escallonia herrerae]|uniref:RING-type domain-containing protein n=1 Tax=Escallonia herrerae TaxID=1293975 RepID=A0AA88WGD3_9ASTE|nr:hypothetical protein RJ639_040428 [Escallonia herrerae]